MEPVSDIYPLSHGTLVINWEDENDNIISLEIGQKLSSYYVEIGANMKFDEERTETANLGENYKLLAALNEFHSE